MNTGNTYYFIDDFNKICKCENGMKTDESIILETYELVDDINRLVEENEQLKKENNKLHQKIFEMRTNVALDRTEISRQSYTPKEFLDKIEKW